MGTICLWNISDDRKSAELGYELLPEYQKNGIMFETVEKILDFSFKTKNFKSISAYTSRNNLGSINLLKRFNFILSEGEIDENNVDNLIFRIEN